MVEVSRDGQRIYITNSLYGAWDDQFYPDGVGAWMAKIDTDPLGGWAEVWTRGSSRTARTSAAAVCTRCGCRAATCPPIPTATAPDGCRCRESRCRSFLGLPVPGYTVPRAIRRSGASWKT